LSSHVIYTAIFNMIDYPAMSIPVGAVDAISDPVDKDFQPANERDAKIQAAYKPEQYQDAPTAVQLVCRRFRDEEVIGLAKVVGKALKS
jgi:amidase